MRTVLNLKPEIDYCHSVLTRVFWTSEKETQTNRQNAVLTCIYMALLRTDLSPCITNHAVMFYSQIVNKMIEVCACRIEPSVQNKVKALNLPSFIGNAVLSNGILRIEVIGEQKWVKNWSQ